MKVYLAARWEQFALLMAWRQQLLGLGIGCTSTWLNLAADGLRAVEDDQTMLASAIADYRDIIDADALVAYSPKAGHGYGRGGRHVELGIALGLGRPVVLVGERENVFHWHPRVSVLPEYSNAADIARRVREMLG